MFFVYDFLEIGSYNFPCLLKFPQTKGTTSRKVVLLTWLRGLYFIVVQGRGKPQKARKSGLRFFLNHHTLWARRVRNNAAIVQKKRK